MVLYLNKKKTVRLRLPVEQDVLQGVLLRVIIVLSVAAVILGAIGIPFFARIKHVTLEAGSDFTAEDLAKSEDASLLGFDPSCTRRPGVYYFSVISNGKEKSVRLKVVDTKAPEVVVKNVKCAIGGAMPRPLDFIDSLKEADICIGEFVTEFPEIDRMGEYSAQVRFYDPSGNETKIFDVKMSVVSDNEDPKISLSVDKIEIEKGTVVDLLSFAKATDNCVGDVELTVDDEGVDYSAVGDYTVTFSAKDSVGNSSKVSVKLSVVDSGEE